MKNIILALIVLMNGSVAFAQTAALSSSPSDSSSVPISDLTRAPIYNEKYEGKVTAFDSAGKAITSYKMETFVQKLSSAEHRETYIEHMSGGDLTTICKVAISSISSDQKKYAYSCVSSDKEVYSYSLVCKGTACSGSAGELNIKSYRASDRRIHVWTPKDGVPNNGIAKVRDDSVRVYSK